MFYEGISPNPEKDERIKSWPISKNTNEAYSFILQAYSYQYFIDYFSEKATCLHEVIGLVAINIKKSKDQKKKVL